MSYFARFAPATIVLFVWVFMPSVACAKPKKKTYNNSPQQVFDAALRTARERHVVTFVDEKNLMLTFETGVSAFSYGFVANASVEPEGDSKATLVINVQHKNNGKSVSFSLNAGDRMADQFYQQVDEEIARSPIQKSATKPEAAPVAVPETAKRPAIETGSVTITSSPDADVSVDGAFVGNAPATLKLPAGKHTIVVSQKGFASFMREITVLPDGDTKLNATLVKD